MLLRESQLDPRRIIEKRLGGVKLEWGDFLRLQEDSPGCAMGPGQVTATVLASILPGGPEFGTVPARCPSARKIWGRKSAGH